MGEQDRRGEEGVWQGRGCNGGVSSARVLRSLVELNENEHDGDKEDDGGHGGGQDRRHWTTASDSKE